jgi:hypothetical protein
MAEHIIELTEEEEALLQKLITISGSNEKEIIKFHARNPLILSIRRGLETRCAEALLTMTLDEKVSAVEAFIGKEKKGGNLGSTGT